VGDAEIFVARFVVAAVETAGGGRQGEGGY
jgi:hypothetical protein